MFSATIRNINFYTSNDFYRRHRCKHRPSTAPAPVGLSTTSGAEASQSTSTFQGTQEHKSSFSSSSVQERYGLLYYFQN